MKYPITFIHILLFVIYSSAQDLQVSAGRIVRLENFSSCFIQPRNIDIWLPEGYSISKKYRVLYMQDGQMLFNAGQSMTLQEWKVDETLDSLLSKSAIQDCIVVGIWNKGANKLAEYYPQRALEYIPSKRRKKFIKEHMGTEPIADAYLKFVVQELKPYIDKNFSVLNDLNNTFIAGVNTGALISLYAICEYPEVFHAAACISFPYYHPDDHVSDAILKYIKKHIPESLSHAFYCDYEKSTETKHSVFFQKNLDAIFTKKKYSSKNYLNLEYKEDDLLGMNWNKRFNAPMMFLLGK